MRAEAGAASETAKTAAAARVAEPLQNCLCIDPPATASARTSAPSFQCAASQADRMDGDTPQQRTPTYSLTIPRGYCGGAQRPSSSATIPSGHPLSFFFL